MIEKIHKETQKALDNFQVIKRLLVDFEDLKKAIDKNDQREIGRLTFVIEKSLNHLYVGFGGEDMQRAKEEIFERLNDITYTCKTCGAHHEDGGRGKPPVYCDECGADWKQ